MPFDIRVMLIASEGLSMESYTVTWSGEIQKRVRDQQIRPAPPLETAEQNKARLAESEAVRSRFSCVEMARGAAMSTLTEIAPKGAVVYK